MATASRGQPYSQLSNRSSTTNTSVPDNAMSSLSAAQQPSSNASVVPHSLSNAEATVESLTPVALPRIPAPNDIHERWDPKYQAVAKCDFCHSRNSSDRASGVLQLCRDCKMSICQDCCRQKHGAAQGRLDVVQHHGTAGQLTDAQRRWCQFGIQARHTLDPNTVNWDVPAKRTREKQRVPAKQTNATPKRGDTRARRGGGLQGSGRGGRRQVSRRGNSRIDMSPTPSDFIPSPEPDDDGASFADTENFEEDVSLDDVDYDDDVPVGRSPKGAKRSRDAIFAVSPDLKAVEEAAGVLATWSTSAAMDGRDVYKRLKISPPTEASFPSLPPARPSYIPQDRPSLPPLDSIYPSWRDGLELPRGPELRGLPQRQAADVRLDQRGHITRESNAQLAAFYVAEAPSHGEFSYHGHGNTPSHRGHYDNYPSFYHSTEKREIEIQGESPSQYHHDHHTRDSDRSPHFTPYMAMERERSQTSDYSRLYSSSNTAAYPAHPPMSYNSPRPAPQHPRLQHEQIPSFASTLQANALHAHAANPSLPLDDCLARELPRLWYCISPSRPSSSFDQPESTAGTADAFGVLAGAAYTAILGLRLADNNAAHRWLHQTEQRLADSGVSVQIVSTERPSIKE